MQRSCDAKFKGFVFRLWLVVAVKGLIVLFSIVEKSNRGGGVTNSVVSAAVLHYLIIVTIKSAVTGQSPVSLEWKNTM